jgi:calcium permeable stress-gated cation channel
MLATVFAYVLDQPDHKETGGLYFPMAVSNLCMRHPHTIHAKFLPRLTVVGLYIEQLCLAVLFFVKGSNAKVLPLVAGALMVLLFILSLLCHAFIKSSFDRKPRSIRLDQVLMLLQPS